MTRLHNSPGLVLVHRQGVSWHWIAPADASCICISYEPFLDRPLATCTPESFNKRRPLLTSSFPNFKTFNAFGAPFVTLLTCLYSISCHSLQLTFLNIPCLSYFVIFPRTILNEWAYNIGTRPRLHIFQFMRSCRASACRPMLIATLLRPKDPSLRSTTRPHSRRRLQETLRLRADLFTTVPIRKPINFLDRQYA